MSLRDAHGQIPTGNEMKPCPFCGHPTPLQGEGYGSYDHMDTVYVRCGNRRCNASGPEKRTHTEAAKAWNRRKKFPVRNAP